MNLDLFINDFEQKLKEIEDNNYDLKKRANLAIVHCTRTLTKLKKQVLLNTFDSVEDEILFFKKIKPVIIIQNIFYEEVLWFEMDMPKLSLEDKKSYIIKVFKKKERFLKKHPKFVQYIEQDSSYLDSQFFTRKPINSTWILYQNTYSADTFFNTAYDLIFSKIRSYKRFLIFLRKRYNNIDKPGLFGTSGERFPELNWTGSKVALTELIYALHSGKVINGGNVEIKQIAEVFQKLFNTDIGDYYKTYSEIKARQKSKTKFLEELAYSLQDEIKKSDR